MKRLTVKTGVYQDDGHREVAGMKCGVELKDIFDRLAAIEDILGDEYELDRLRELVEADREGRCVVLLSNDDVYTIRGDILNGIIKANCRDACKPPEAALRREQE